MMTKNVLNTNAFGEQLKADSIKRYDNSITYLRETLIVNDLNIDTDTMKISKTN